MYIYIYMYMCVCERSAMRETCKIIHYHLLLHSNDIIYRRVKYVE
jgi:hypothetical protein